MEQLFTDDPEENRILYYDTDSIIYITDLTNPNHKMIEIGSPLGEMTNELKGFGKDAYICEFVSGGPKNYAFKVDGADDGKIHTIMKFKGFSINDDNKKPLNFDALKDMVIKFVESGHVIERNIVTTRIQTQLKDRKVLTKKVPKKFRVLYDKRVVSTDFNTYPFGW